MGMTHKVHTDVIMVICLPLVVTSEQNNLMVNIVVLIRHVLEFF